MAAKIPMSGHITRSNLTPAQTPLDILVDPYWPLLGDTQEAADMSMEAGIDPGQSALKAVWADSPYVAGRQLVLATPDNSTLVMRFLVSGTTITEAATNMKPIIQAIRDQMSYQVSVTIGAAATFTWNCYTGTYLPSFNQLFYFGNLFPLYVSLPRTPIPVAGAI